MKLHLPRRRISRLAVYFICLVLVLLAADMLWVESRRTIHPGFQTTRIVSPTLPDGSIDYLTALEAEYSQGVTNENNAAPLLLEALGRAALPKNQPPDGITTRLGLEHLPEDGDYLVDYEAYCRKQRLVPEDDPLDRKTLAPWPVKIGPVTAQWIKDNEKPLNLIVEASRRPRFFLPYYGGRRPETLLEILLPHIKLMPEIRRALLSRALLRLEAGDVTGFEQDVLAVHRLARLLAQAPTLIERMSAVRSLEIPACQMDCLAAISGKLSAADSKRLLASLTALPELPALSDSLDGERYLVLDTLQVLANINPTRAGELLHAIGGLSDSSLPPPFMFNFLPIPYDESMRAMNHFYDSAIATLRWPRYHDRVEGLRHWSQSSLSGRSYLPALLPPDWPARIFLPSLQMAEASSTAGRMERRLAEVALALAACKAEHHEFPSRLSELSPAYLPVIPEDLFSDRPLKFSREQAGYHLYSVGPNMRDETGEGDDLSVRQRP